MYVGVVVPGENIVILGLNTFYENRWHCMLNMLESLNFEKISKVSLIVMFNFVLILSIDRNFVIFMPKLIFNIDNIFRILYASIMAILKLVTSYK